jgi:hypothetical protein
MTSMKKEPLGSAHMLEKVNEGWMPYSLIPFREDLDEIMRLLGSKLYEVCIYEGVCYVRRIE